MLPFASPAAKAASAPATLPFAVTKEGLKLEDIVRSSVWMYVPEVTPRGKQGKVGTVVATGAFAEGSAQQWMWEAVVPDPRPENTTSTKSVWAVES